MKENPAFTARCLTIALMSVIFLAESGLAQESKPADTGDEVVEMSEFVVTSTPDDGYGASMTATGSRVAEKIQNLPYAIEVITAEMLDDLGFDDLDEDFAYASSFTGIDSDGGGMNIRGMRVGKQLRNGFLRIGVFARSNVERIEIIKGPSAAIYGECLPAGLVNIVTRAPKNKRTYEFAARVATNDYFSTSGQATGGIGSKTSYIINASYMTKEYEQPFAVQRNQSYSAAVEHKFSNNTRLLVEAEYVKRHAAPTSAVPVRRVGTSSSTYRYVGFAWEVAGLNYYGPAEHTKRSMMTYNATFEHRINKVWSFRAAANWFKRDVNLYKTVDGGGGTRPIYDSETKLLISRAPAFGMSDESGYGVQADMLARYGLCDGVLENKTLFTVDFSSYNRINSQIQPTATQAKNAGFATQMDPNNPNYFWPSPEDYPDIYKLDRYTDGTTDILGAFLRHQTAIWGGKFIIVGGMRYDYVMENLRNETWMRLNPPQSTRASVQKNNQGHFTPNVGINFRVVDGLRGYVNYARSFFVDAQSNSAPVDPDAPQDLENEGGYGIDYGVKVSLFKDRLKFTFGGFYILREHMRTTDEYEESRRIGSILSRGLEFDATYRIENHRGLTALRFGYGHSNAVYVYAGRDLQRIGRPMAGVPADNAYVAFTQSWKRGFLKGFRCSLGITYTGASYPWSDNGGKVADGDTDGFYRGQSGFADIKIPSYFSTRAGVGYEWRTGKIKHAVNVSMTNLLDDDCLMRNRNIMEPFGCGVQYKLKF